MPGTLGGRVPDGMGEGMREFWKWPAAPAGSVSVESGSMGAKDLRSPRCALFMDQVSLATRIRREVGIQIHSIGNNKMYLLFLPLL